MDEKSENFIRQMSEKAVLIYDSDGVSHDGHGVLITSNGYILSAAHLFDSAEKHVRVKCYSEINTEEFHLAEIIELDAKVDLALLKIEAKNCEHGKLAEEFEIGQDLHIVVCFSGTSFTYTRGSVAFERRRRGDIVEARSKNIEMIDDETIFLQGHGLHGKPGYSGAGIFDSKGHIVAIYSTAYSRADLLIHLSHLKALSQRYIQPQEEKGKKRKRKRRRKEKKL